MTLSVAMATFNGGRHLQAQLDSIRRQTLLPAELIVCDDGSTDETMEILRRFAADAPFRVVVDAHGQRLGFTRNFLRAIGQCTGQIVALCDQDDVWDERKLAVCAPVFTDPAVMTVTHRVRVVDENLHPSGMILPSEGWRGRYTLFDMDPWYSPNGMQLLFRREPVVPWLVEPAPLTIFEWFVTETFDEWIYHTGLLLGTAIMLEEILGVWRRHGGVATIELDALAQMEAGAQSLQLALHSDGGAYVLRSRVADSRAEFAARGLGSPVAGAVEYFRRVARTYRRRVRLHDPKSGRLERLRTFAGMAAQGDYRRQRRGGLGAKAVLKDAYSIFFRRRVPVQA